MTDPIKPEKQWQDNADTAAAVRAGRAAGKSVSALAEEFGLSEGAITNIINKRWRKLNAQAARDIRVAHSDGKSIQDLAEEFGVSDSTIWNVVNYETWVSAGPKSLTDHWAQSAAKEKKASR